MDGDYPRGSAEITDPAVVARWLRLCGDPVDRCHKCPYGCAEPGEDGKGCMEVLHGVAAELIERKYGDER